MPIKEISPSTHATPGRSGSRVFRRVAGLASVIGCLGIAGCSTPVPIQSDASWEQFRLAMEMTEKAPVPPPENNPFSRVSAEAAKAYLDEYYEGYRIGLAGYYLTPMFKDSPTRAAKKDGYEAGVRAGLKQSNTKTCATGLYLVR